MNKDLKIKRFKNLVKQRVELKKELFSLDDYKKQIIKVREKYERKRV